MQNQTKPTLQQVSSFVCELNKQLDRSTNDFSPIALSKIWEILPGVMQMLHLSLDNDIANALQKLDEKKMICLAGFLGICEPSDCSKCTEVKNTDIWPVWIECRCPFVVVMPPRPNRTNLMARSYTSMDEYDELKKFEELAIEFGQLDVFQQNIEHIAWDIQMQPKPKTKNHFVADAKPNAKLDEKVVPKNPLSFDEKTVICRYGLSCHKIGCAFVHPNQYNCKFGYKCNRPGCIYKHTFRI